MSERNKELKEFTEKDANDCFNSEKVKLYAKSLLTLIKSCEGEEMPNKVLLDVLKRSLSTVIDGSFVETVEKHKREHPYAI